MTPDNLTVDPPKLTRAKSALFDPPCAACYGTGMIEATKSPCDRCQGSGRVYTSDPIPAEYEASLATTREDYDKAGGSTAATKPAEGSAAKV